MKGKIMFICGIMILFSAALFSLSAGSSLTSVKAKMKLPDTQITYEPPQPAALEVTSSPSGDPVNIFTRNRGKKIETAIAAAPARQFQEENFELKAIFRYGDKFGAVISRKNPVEKSPTINKRIFFSGDLITANVTVKNINQTQAVLIQNGGEISLKLQKESANAKKR